MTSKEREDLERQLKQEAQKESAEQLAQILPRLEAMQRAKLAKETLETLRAKARASLNVALEAKKEETLEEICKNLPKEAKERAQDQWQIVLLFEAVQRGLQTTEEAKSLLKFYYFTGSFFFQLQADLARACCTLGDAVKKAHGRTLEEGLELLPQVAKKLSLIGEKIETAQKVVQSPKAWQDLRGLSSEEWQKLLAKWQGEILPKFESFFEDLEDNF